MSLALDPRTRLGLVAIYAGLVIATSQLPWLLLELGLILLLVLVAREAHSYARWLRVVGLMAITWFAITLWAFDASTAITATVRLLALTSAFFLLFRTTPPHDLGNALVKSGLPYEVAFVLSTSLQFVPVISRKAQNTLDAQRARGIPLEPGLKALRHYPALMAPLLVQSFELAEELAEAMESRGFGRPGRTFAREYRMRPLDWLALAGGTAALAAIVVIR